MLNSKNPKSAARKKRRTRGDIIEKLRDLPRTIVTKQLRAWRWLSWLFLLIILLANGAAIWAYRQQMQGQGEQDWLPEVIISSFLIFSLFIIIYIILSSRQKKIQFLLSNAIQEEYGYLRSAIKRAQALQEMATTLRGTLSLDRVLDSALNVCQRESPIAPFP